MPCHEGGLGFTGNPSLFSGMLDCFHSRGWAHCRSSPGCWLTCTWHSIMLALPLSAWKNVPMNYYKHWYCDQPTTGYGCCWKTQHLISKTCWWPIVYGQMRTSSSGLVTPVLVPNSLLKHHSVSCTPLPIPPVLGSLCVNRFPGRSVPLEESHPISPRWVTSPSVPPPKGCHELLILPTMLWCCGLSASYRAVHSHVLEGGHGPPPSAKPLCNTQRLTDWWKKDFLDLSQICFLILSYPMITQQLEPVFNLALLKWYRTMTTLPAHEVWVNIGHLNFER